MEMKVLSERQRRIADEALTPSSIITSKIEPNSVFKHLVIRLSGVVTTTFASGTPVADAFSIMDNIIPRIDLTVNGSRTVKSVRPHMLRMQQLLVNKVATERRSSAGASAALDNYPTVDQGFVYGSTTNITTVAETVILSFENIYANQVQAPLTWLNLKGESSCELKFTTAAFSSFLGYGNTAPVVYSADNMIIQIATVEAQHVPEKAATSDWKQTTKDVSYSAEQTETLIEINPGNTLQAVNFLARNGAAGSTTTATGRIASNLVLTKMKMLINGQSVIKDTDFKLLQAEMIGRYGVNAPMASNVSVLDGFARLDFCQFSNGKADLNSALRLKRPDVNSANVALSTNNSTNTDYTVPITVTLMTEELVLPQ